MQLLFDATIKVFDKALTPYGIDADSDSKTYYYVYNGAKRAAIIVVRVFNDSGLISYRIIETEYSNTDRDALSEPGINGGLMSPGEFQSDLEEKLTNMIQPVYKIPSNALAEPFIKFNEALKVAIKKLFR